LLSGAPTTRKKYKRKTILLWIAIFNRLNGLLEAASLAKKMKLPFFVWEEGALLFGAHFSAFIF
jgi:hypothetical protein